LLNSVRQGSRRIDRPGDAESAPIRRSGREKRRAAVVVLLALSAVGAASAGLPRNLTPPRLYGEFVAGRR
jgi:hypothetical protein